MRQLIGFIDNDLKDFFIKKPEELCYFCYNFLKVSPYLLCYGELDSFLGNLPEKASDSLIVAETPGYGEYVISYGADSGVSYLGCKISALTLPKSEILLAVLYDHLQAPSPGVKFPRPEDIKGHVRGEKAVPLAVPASLYEKDPYRHAVKVSIRDYVVGLQPPAVPHGPRCLGFLCQCGCADSAVFGVEACLALSFIRFAYLYHPKPVTSHMAGFDESYDVSAGEPAVCQHIFEFYLVLDSPSDKILGKLDLGHPVFPLSFLEHVAITFKLLASFDFLVAEAVVAFPARLPHYGKVQKELGSAIGDSHEETLEAKYTFMFKVGEHSSDILHGTSRLMEVRVIQYKAGIPAFGICTHPNLVPQLPGYAPQSLSPRHRGVLEEAIEDILLCVQQDTNCGIFAAENVFHTQIGKQYQTLEHSKTPVKSIALVLYAKCAAVGHPDLGKYLCYGLHGSREVFIAEKFFDFRNKRSNFVYRHGPEVIFWWYLKLLIFCQLGKKPCRFFMSFYL